MILNLRLVMQRYKLADREMNPAPGSNNKKMNWNDREKVALMNDILSKRSKPFARVSTSPRKKVVRKMENNLNNIILA